MLQKVLANRTYEFPPLRDRCDTMDRLVAQGRTGVMLACVLVHRGHSAEEAIRAVRRLRPPSIDTPTQERFVHLFMEASRNGTNGSPTAR